jgi:hypothetical protein
MYVRQKAVLSSQIEGIQASLSMGLKKSPFGCGSYERFINSDDHMPILVRCALTYEQFEIIHPFLDGNGRLGRLLITFMLCERKVLKRPLLYLSLSLKRNRSEYYDKLNAVRTYGDFEGWIKFFFRGVAEISIEATRAILKLREEHRTLLMASGFATANDIVARFVEPELLQEITGKQRRRRFAYVPHLEIFTQADACLDRADSALASD